MTKKFFFSTSSNTSYAHITQIQNICFSFKNRIIIIVIIQEKKYDKYFLYDFYGNHLWICFLFDRTMLNGWWWKKKCYKLIQFVLGIGKKWKYFFFAGNQQKWKKNKWIDDVMMLTDRKIVIIIIKCFTFIS